MKTKQTISKKTYIIAFSVLALAIIGLSIASALGWKLTGYATAQSILLNPDAGNDIQTANFVLKSDGKVGIGTNTPQYGKLAIHDVSTPLVLRETATGVSGDNVASVDQGGLWRMPVDGGILRFDVNTGVAGSEFGSNYKSVVSMKYDGKVGIGTNTPRAKLDIVTTSTDSGDSIVFGTGVSTYPTVPRTAGAIVGKGGTSDFRIDIQDGTGRVNYLWNAYTDGTTTAVGGAKNEYIVAGEPATRLYQGQEGGCDMNDPDPTKKSACEVGGIGGAVFQFFGAPTAGRDKQGTEIPWTSIATLKSNSEYSLEVNGKTKTTGLTVASSGITLNDDQGNAYCLKITQGFSQGTANVVTATVGACT